MKKVLKLLLAIILAIVILGGVMFLVDCSMVNSDKAPVFARETKILEDGGTIEYMGLGYKIIDFNKLNGYDETKVGLWYIKYEDYEEEYKKLDENIPNDESNNNEENNIGDDGYGDPQEIVSGDIIDDSEKNVGVLPTGDPQKPNDASGEITSGDNIIDSETINGDDGATEEGHYFNATVIGINNRNLVVQALEDEAINASADMFSFSLPETDSTVYLIGQKVSIKYTGTIRETYPAQIDVIGIEIIE